MCPIVFGDHVVCLELGRSRELGIQCQAAQAILRPGSIITSRQITGIDVGGIGKDGSMGSRRGRNFLDGRKRWDM